MFRQVFRMSTFGRVSGSPNLVEFEREILELWHEGNFFEKGQQMAAHKPAFTFYDGPPFATGLPHYGHLLAGTIKDVICRYFYQQNLSVSRRFGWDCHGLPVEYEIDKDLNIRSAQDREELGLAAYNEKCRSIVLRYTEEWETTVRRMGRWIDFENGYRTMDVKFMESVFWVFSELFKKGFVERSFRVMPFSTGCQTPLSNFEVSQNYRDVSDPSVMVRFKVRDPPFQVDNLEWYFYVWTTTPWTLPSNLALCMNPDLRYSICETDTEVFIVGTDRLDYVQKRAKINYKVLQEEDGRFFKDYAYEPLLPYFEGHPGAFRVCLDEYVTPESGTCVVHQAPAFGQVDLEVCVANQIVTATSVEVVIDDFGKFTSRIPEYKGLMFKEADPLIIQRLKKEEKLVASGKEVHSYPHCWRSDTPLIYKAVPSWFIKLESVVPQLVANNKDIHWVPSNVGEKRFHNWLTNSRDWCVSRSRFWGTPIPLWVSEDYEEIKVISSVAELQQYSDTPIHDLHRESIDHIEIPSSQGKGMLKRIPEVFDCWFESGSMPYGQVNYPFSQQDLTKIFPAQFIAEGIDQTRGWFYTLLVISTLLFQESSYKNVICNGLVLAEDGKKMSKRLGNYPQPTVVIEEFGADAVRLYLLSSPAVRGENLCFQKAGVGAIVREVFLPYYHAYRFFVQQWERLEAEEGQISMEDLHQRKSENLLDIWILGRSQELMTSVHQEMSSYRLYTVVPFLVTFLEDLTNWYVRMNRDRMKNPEDRQLALSTLYRVLLNVTVLFAPVAPFLTEHIYQNLKKGLKVGDPRRQESVHFVMHPDLQAEPLNPQVSTVFGHFQQLVDLGRQARERRKIGMKMPVASVTLIHDSPDLIDQLLADFGDYLREALNTKELIPQTEGSTFVLKGIPNWGLLGKRLGKEMGRVAKELSLLGSEDLKALQSGAITEITVAGHILSQEEVVFKKEFLGQTTQNLEVSHNMNWCLILDCEASPALISESLAREAASCVQKMRKASNLLPQDPIRVSWSCEDPQLSAVLTTHAAYISVILKKPFAPSWEFPVHLEESHAISEMPFKVRIHWDA